MRTVYTLIFIALLTITCNDALPYASKIYSVGNFPTNVVDQNIVRREEYDPYGFNSILSRFYKRSKLTNLAQHINEFPNKQAFI